MESVVTGHSWVLMNIVNRKNKKKIVSDTLVWQAIAIISEVDSCHPDKKQRSLVAIVT